MSQLNEAAINAIAKPDAQSEHWVIHLKPLPSQVPVAIRVRQVLKYALRAQGLKAVRVTDPTPYTHGTALIHEPDCDVWDGRPCNCEPR